MKQDDLQTQANEPNMHRRRFLTNMGLTAVAVSGLTACTKMAGSENVSGNSIDDAKAAAKYGDTAILNYAYLLEQLEAAFYMMVTSSFYSGASSLEKMRLQEIRDHEIAHREFFKTALGSNAIPEQEFDFSTIDFSDRMSVLGASKTFEDTGVSAYNGIGYAIRTPDYLLAAGKIVSVEARHAAYIRDLLDPLSFADSTVVDANGLDVASKPYVVIQAVAPYLKTKPNLKSFPFNL